MKIRIFSVISSIILLAYAALFTAGCGGSGGSSYYGSQGPGSPVSSGASVRGLVTDSQGGGVLQGVTVTVQSLSAVTDSNGYYEIAGLAAGTWAVSASRSGYQNSSGTVQLAAQESAFCSLAMTPVAASGGILAGQITDSSNGAPLGGATLTCGSLQTKSGSRGIYALSGLPAGTVNFTATKTGYRDYSGSASIVDDQKTIRQFAMEPLATSGSIQGTVTDQATGAPLESVTVSAGGSSAVTDRNGSYLLTGVAAGSLTIAADRSGYAPYSAAVTAKAGQTVHHSIAMTALTGTGGITGTVTDSSTGLAIEGAVISAGSVRTVSDTEGSYLLTGIAAGSYTLTAAKAGYTGASASVQVLAGQMTGQDMEMSPETGTGAIEGTVYDSATGSPVEDALVTAGSASATTDREGIYQLTGVTSGQRTVTAWKSGYQSTKATVTVTAGDVVTEDIPLTALAVSGSLSGIVTDAVHGSPLPDAVVSAGAHQTTTDSHGYYHLSGLAAGPQQVTAQKTGYGEYAATVQITAGAETTQDMALTPLPDTGIIRGAVTDAETGGAIPRAWVWSGFRVTRADSDGRYQLHGVPAGTRWILAIRHAYFIYTGTVTVTAGSAVVRNISMTPFTLRGTVAGKVTDRDTGSPVARARVSIGFISTFTDRQGDYELTGVLAGLRLITALRTGYHPSVETIIVTAGRRVTHNISMSPRGGEGSIQGTITDGTSGRALEGVEVTAGSAHVTSDARGRYELHGVPSGNRILTAHKNGYDDYQAIVTVESHHTAIQDIAMSPRAASGSVSGTVTDQKSGLAVEDALVSIGSSEVSTDRSGAYSLTGITAGSHTLIVEKSGYQDCKLDIQITAGKDLVRTISLTPESSAGASTQCGLSLTPSSSGLTGSVRFEQAVTINGSSIVDSFDSSKGPYEQSSAKSGENIATNSTSTGIATLEGNAQVYGTVTAGTGRR